MNKEFEVLQNLTEAQKQEFENDIQQLYAYCYNQTKGELQKLIDVTTNLRLEGEVFLKVTFEFDPNFGVNGKGRITQLSKYPNKLAYEAAVAAEKNLN
ncbi:hypothetical protein [Flagellimonas olearia]|uniref:Uncharacterized protein n=1 Tax=Flagellimonas olearia TaxID=552546 RepID=A0A444VM66_9FLAO|nr:hypothetical protein [Allomuricauda olearia]RYC51863.1 hypothetical protein DN53_08215 [Allomuricauda olearia]